MARLTAFVLFLTSLLIPAQSALAATIADKPLPHPPFKKLWQCSGKAQIEDYIVVNKTICFGTSESYGAVDIATGKVLWEKELPDKCYDAYIAHDVSTLYVAVEKGDLIACNPRTGKKKWSLPSVSSSPIAYYNGLLFMESKNGILTALDVSTRKVLWECNTAPDPLPQSSGLHAGWADRPLIAESNMLVGTWAGEILCIDQRTGKVQWRHTQGDPYSNTEDRYISSMCCDDSHVYFATDKGEVGALDIAAGKTVWSTALPGKHRGDVLIDKDLLLVSAYCSGDLCALKAADGSVLWSAAVAEPEHPERPVWLSLPVVQSGRILITGNTLICSYDRSGNKLWEWDTDEPIYGDKLTLLPDGILAPGSEGRDTTSGLFLRFAMGQPPKQPKTHAGRLKAARQMAAVLDGLTNSQQRRLRKLGDEAFQAVWEVVDKRLDAYNKLANKGKSSEDARREAYDKLFNASQMLVQVATIKHTPQMLALYKKAIADSRWPILMLLAEKADDKKTAPIFLALLKEEMADPKHKERLPANAHEKLLKSSHPPAVDFFIKQLNDPKAPAHLRRSAFAHLAGTGGEKGLKAVLAHKSSTRTIRDIAEVMYLDKLCTHEVPPDKNECDSPVCTAPVRLIAKKTDESRELWGLIASRVIGSNDDLWIVRHDGSKWLDPVFTGTSRKQLGDTDWFARFVENQDLTKDSDNDGWTDMMEQRLGTDPQNTDTDGDGLKDSQDMNPLAAPRKLGDEEQIMAASFEALNIFSPGSEVACIVHLPKGTKPFELPCWGWIIVPETDDIKPPITKFSAKGTASVRFEAPRQYPWQDEDEEKTILWNNTRTEAKVVVGSQYGPLAGVGYEFTVKKFGDRWVVTGMKMAWIS